jgi:hypothetical protein
MLVLRSVQYYRKVSSSYRNPFFEGIKKVSTEPASASLEKVSDHDPGRLDTHESVVGGGRERAVHGQRRSTRRTSSARYGCGQVSAASALGFSALAVLCLCRL